LDLTLTWIYGYLKQADMNKDGKMSYKEVQILFKMINIDLNDEYAVNLFKVSLIPQQHLTCFEMLQLEILYLQKVL